MNTVEIYIKPTCPYCKRARALLEQKGIEHQVIDITEEPQRRDEMIERAEGRHTVPQIFINGVGIGGCDDLYHLEQTGELDALLAS